MKQNIICCLRRKDLKTGENCVRKYSVYGDNDVLLKMGHQSMIIDRKDAKLLAKRINQFLEATK